MISQENMNAIIFSAVTTNAMEAINRLKNR